MPIELLLLAQGGYGIDAAGAPGGEKTRQQSRCYEQGDHKGEGRYLGGLHSLHQPPQHTPRGQGGGSANANAHENHSKALAEHQRLHYIPEPAVRGSITSSDGTTLALKATDGSVVWQRTAGPGDQFVDADASPQIAGSRVYVASFRDGIYSVERTRGDLVWHKPFPGATGLLLQDGILFATAIGKVAAFSPGDGTLLWEMGLGDRTPGVLRVAGPVLMVPTTDSLLFLDDHSGARLGAAFSPGRGVDAAPAAAGREVYVLSNAGWLYALGLM